MYAIFLIPSFYARSISSTSKTRTKGKMIAAIQEKEEGIERK
jgi:hypothetical protein